MAWVVELALLTSRSSGPAACPEFAATCSALRLLGSTASVPPPWWPSLLGRALVAPASGYRLPGSAGSRSTNCATCLLPDKVGHPQAPSLTPVQVTPDFI